jgi:hypothetical protein
MILRQACRTPFWTPRESATPRLIRWLRRSPCPIQREQREAAQPMLTDIVIGEVWQG